MIFNLSDNELVLVAGRVRFVDIASLALTSKRWSNVIRSLLKSMLTTPAGEEQHFMAEYKYVRSMAFMYSNTGNYDADASDKKEYLIPLKRIAEVQWNYVGETVNRKKEQKSVSRLQRLYVMMYMEALRTLLDYEGDHNHILLDQLANGIQNGTLVNDIDSVAYSSLATREERRSGTC